MSTLELVLTVSDGLAIGEIGVKSRSEEERSEVAALFEVAIVIGCECYHRSFEIPLRQEAQACCA